MKYILVLNCGSATVKWALFEQDLSLVHQEKVERIGLDQGPVDHRQAIGQALEAVNQDYLEDSDRIKAVGHRVVHGGDEFQKAVEVDRAVIEKLKEYNKLAPLHNPNNIAGIEAIKEILPEVPQVAHFDTAFYSELPQTAEVYPLPDEFYREGIKRYGFQGISHQYVMEQAYRELEQKPDRLITCHLGSGSSVTAIKNKKPVNTTMGLTPLEGLVMTTRPGDIDPGIIIHLIREMDYDVDQVDELLNHESGLLGICGERDFREVLKKKSENQRAKLAFEMYCNSVAKYIGYYAALLEGVDAIVFTAGIGEKSWEVREEVIDKFEFVGMKLNPDKNKDNNLIISSEDSDVEVLVIPTNEELKIAQETKQLLR